MAGMFRDLKANEIDCRVAQVYEQDGKPIGLTVLLYKDARVDINILNETLGVYGWQRRHTRDNANCIISIWDDTNKQWVEKEDTGTESYTEKEKGLASDSFKRACFNLGIGIELYTAPLIYIKSERIKNWKRNNNGNYTTKDRLRVKHIKTVDGRIEELVIFNETTKDDVFKYGF